MTESNTNNSIDSDKLMHDKDLFYKTVYTPLSEAIKILEERQKDIKLKEKIENILKGNIPEPLREMGKNGVMFRQVATPNFEIRWFIELTKDHGLQTVFFEYYDDKFTSNNFYKHSLGQLRIHENKRNKIGENIEEKITIVDFNKYNGKKIRDVLTLWNEPLVDFHKKLFSVYDSDPHYKFFDASRWFKENGEIAINYYTNLLLLFVCHGIIFENFLFNGDECEFTKNVLLPAFNNAVNIAGIKPLIVPIPPMDSDIEEDIHWHSYSPNVKSLLNLQK